MAVRVSPDAPVKGPTLAYLPALDGIRGVGDYLAPAILPYWMELGHLQEAHTSGASIPAGTLPRYFAPQ